MSTHMTKFDNLVKRFKRRLFTKFYTYIRKLLAGFITPIVVLVSG